MKQVKSLLLAGAAGLAAMTTAQAADLPVKAKAVEYVKICSLYGAGFYFIPGTDTCIRFGGYMRLDITGNGTTQNIPGWNGSIGAGDRFAHDFIVRPRFQFGVDLRTQTQYGVVRVFAQTNAQFDTYSASGGISPAALTSAGQAGTLNNFTPGNGFVGVENAFLQFAGFTFGKSMSARAVPWNASLANNNTSGLLGGPDYIIGVNNIQYTYSWGNGVSTTIGLDEPVVLGRANLGNVLNGATGGTNVAFLGTTSNSYAGQSMPDIVGNFKIDQAWGIFTVAGGVHEVRAANYNSGTATTAGNELSGYPETKYGYSGTAGIQINNVPTGAGDRFTVDATYAKGFTRTLIATTGSTPNFAIFGDGITGLTYQSVGFGFTSDGLYSGTGTANGTGIELTTAYGARAAFIHNWTKEVQSSLFGSYTRVDYNGNATTIYCTQYRRITGIGTNFTCNPDFSIAQVGFRTGWTPVSGLTFSGEILYTALDQKFTGTGGGAALAAPSSSLSKPGGVAYNYKDQDVISVNFRAQRNF